MVLVWDGGGQVELARDDVPEGQKWVAEGLNQSAPYSGGNGDGALGLPICAGRVRSCWPQRSQRASDSGSSFFHRKQQKHDVCKVF